MDPKYVAEYFNAGLVSPSWIALNYANNECFFSQPVDSGGDRYAKNLQLGPNNMDEDGIIRKERVPTPDTWKLRTRRFVLLVDIMGFRKLLKPNLSGSLYHLMRRFELDTREYMTMSQWKARGSSLEGVGDDAGDQDILRFAQFSDSILVLTKNESKSSYFSLITAAENLFITAAEYGFAIRGAIARGRITVDFQRSIFFGQPIADAYELGNELRWYGIVEHRSVYSDGFDTFVDMLGIPHTLVTKVPTKHGPRNLPAVAWPLVPMERRVVENVIRGLCANRPKKVRSYGTATAVFARELWKLAFGDSEKR